jgi:hypothetical protein
LKVFYRQQDSIFRDTIFRRNVGASLTIDLGIDSAVTTNIYKWFKNGNFFRTITGNNQLVFNSLQFSDTSIYTCEVSNPNAPLLTLYSRKAKIILNCVPIDTMIRATICQGANYRLVDGRIVSDSGTYRSTLRGNGLHCDTLVTTLIRIQPILNRADSVMICANGIYILPDGRTVTQAGIYTSTLAAYLGCDSLVIRTRLSVFQPQPTRRDTVSTCYNTPYRLPDGRLVSAAGDYTSILRSQVGNCDSLTVLTHLNLIQRALLPLRPISTAGLGTADIRFSFNNLDTNFRYTLRFGDSLQQNIRLGDTIWHHYQQDGTYQVQLILYAPCGTDTFRVNLPIVTPLRVTLAYPRTVCESDTVRFQYLTQSGAVTNQFWNLQNATPNFSLLSLPVATYRTAGKWQVRLQVQNALTSLDLVDSITVKPRARANFNYTANGLTLQFNQTATAAINYRWEFGDGTFSNNPSQTHAYSQSGTYEVRLIVSNDCNQDTMRQMIFVGNTATQYLQFVNSLKLMPNPAQDELTIQLELKRSEKITFRLLNLLGQEQMKRQPATAKTFEQSFDVSGLSNGSYLLQIMGENGLMINEKVVIQH